MKLMVVHPGADWSVADVYNGYVGALKRAGHEIINYGLSGRIAVADEFLEILWRRMGQPPEAKPTQLDRLAFANMELPSRALRFEPDWVLVITAAYVLPDFLIQLRRAGFPVAIIFTESPYDDEEQSKWASLVDVCFTHERASVAGLREANPNTFYLPHAYDPYQHKPAAPSGEVAQHDVVFVGTGFAERIEILRDVNWDGIDLGLYGTWQMLGSRNRLRKHLRGGIIPNGMAVDLYRSAKIGLNLYRTSKGYGRDQERIEWGESLNPRALELAACGVFTISDYRPEVEEVFGTLVPTFSNGSELEETIRYYLAHPDERAEIAAKLPGCVAAHTFDARAKQLIETLSNYRAPTVRLHETEAHNGTVRRENRRILSGDQRERQRD